MVAIPFSDTASFTQEVTLDGTPFNLKLVFNTRGEFWTLSISDVENVVIVSGIKLVLDFALLTAYQHIVALPPGNLIVNDPSGNRDRPAFGDFTGDRGLELIYMTEEELASVS